MNRAAGAPSTTSWSTLTVRSRNFACHHAAALEGGPLGDSAQREAQRVQRDDSHRPAATLAPEHADGGHDRRAGEPPEPQGEPAQNAQEQPPHETGNKPGQLHGVSRRAAGCSQAAPERPGSPGGSRGRSSGSPPGSRARPPRASASDSINVATSTSSNTTRRLRQSRYALRCLWAAIARAAAATMNAVNESASPVSSCAGGSPTRARHVHLHEPVHHVTAGADGQRVHDGRPRPRNRLDLITLVAHRRPPYPAESRLMARWTASRSGLLPRIVEEVEVELVHDVGVTEPRIGIREGERASGAGRSERAWARTKGDVRSRPEVAERIPGRHAHHLVHGTREFGRGGQLRERRRRDAELPAAFGERRIGPGDRARGADAITGRDLDREVAPIVHVEVREQHGFSQQRPRPEDPHHQLVGRRRQRPEGAPRGVELQGGQP